MNKELNLKTLIVKKPLKLDCGKTINDFPIAIGKSLIVFPQSSLSGFLTIKVFKFNSLFIIKAII